MFPNLDAEQARKGLTNQQVAEKIGLSRVSYERKKHTGKFYITEAAKLCRLFSCEYEYLFRCEKTA